VFIAASAVQAQPRPGAFTTVTATDTSATAVCVGCAIGTTTPVVNSGLIAQSITLPTGAPTITTNKLYSVGGSLFFNGVGLAAGSSVSGTTGKLSKFLSATSLGDSLLSESGTAVTVGGTTLALSGVITDTAFGAHLFSAAGTGGQTLTLRNTTAGTANGSGLNLGSDVINQTLVEAYSSTYTPAAYRVASGSSLIGQGTGGLSLATTDGAAVMRFYTSAAERMRLSAAGGLSIGNTVDPGAGSLRITGNNTVLGNEAVTGNLAVTGTSTLGATTTGAITAASLGVTGAATVGTTLGVTGAATLSSTLGVTGAAGFSSTISVAGNATLPSRFQIVSTGSLVTAVAGQMVLANGTFNVTLPAATAGAVVDVKNVGAGVITVLPASGAIDGIGSYALSVQYQSVTVVADGTNWWIR
jgi:hypothetical protein